MAAAPISIGDVFGRLMVIEAAWVPNGRRRARGWRCRCRCGGECVVAPAKLRSGRIVSCGCHRRELSAERARARRTHGENARNSATYRSWLSMIQRCANPNHEAFERYGGAGVTIAERWRGPGGFERFRQDLGERPEGHTLDRIEPAGNYEPGNCRWATPLQQRHNRR